MSSKREQIILAVKSALEAVSGVEGRVYRSLPDPNDRDACPWIGLSWDSEINSPQTVPLLERTLTVHVGIYTRGDEPDALADPIAVDVHSKLLADPTLGGLAIDIRLTGASFDAQGADLAAGKLTHDYEIMFRHSYGDMTQ